MGELTHTPVDITIDYLWGHTAELILSALKGQGFFTPKTRFVSVGSITGDKIQLPAEFLRSADLQLSGSGLGSWTKDEMRKLFTEIIPEMFQLVVDNKLKIETETVQLQDIGQFWELVMKNGKRLVVTI